MVTLTIAIVYRPWKIEKFGEYSMEIGLWTICRFEEDNQVDDFRCYDDFYKENDVERKN